METVRYNFVIPSSEEVNLEQLRNEPLEKHWRLCCRGEYCWSYLTYIRLVGQGLDVSLSSELDPKAINLGHGNTLRDLPSRHDCYCVSLQADFPHYPLAQYHVVQNQMQVGLNSVFMPLWPQYGQAKRDPSRKTVEVVAYQGARAFSELDEERLNRDLQPAGITFRILDDESWLDLQDVDVLIGIRAFGQRDYKRKPPSKLSNAWHAGIPFIGGWDSAYEQIAMPGEDYIRVSSHDELVSEIIGLKDSPERYAQLVQRGEELRGAYTTERLIKRWKVMLERDIAESYREWKGLPFKRPVFEVKKMYYTTDAFLRHCLRQFYKIEAVKRIRDRYYDPVR